MSSQDPFVSIITCTYNRANFLQNLIRMVSYQDYPHSKIEWIIIDDSDVTNASVFPANIDGITVRYYHLKKKIPLGKKRDLLNNTAKGMYLINMDDDDFYPPTRVSHSVSELIRTGYPLAGSSKMFMYFCKDRGIRQLGPYQENHGTAATLAYTKEYTKTHFYFDQSNGHYAEEGVFTEGWKHRMVQLDPMKTVLALSHTDNTIEKTMFLEEKYGQMGRTVKTTTLKLEDFINKDKHPEIYNFYNTLPYEYKLNDLSKEVLKKMEAQAVQIKEQEGPQNVLQRMASEIQLFTFWKHKKANFGI
jgi:glycosyltransferase involved in cell wall biosynthesis